MARLKRIVVPGEVHLIVQAAQAEQPVFASAPIRQLHLGILRDAAREAGVAVHAYAFDDHELRLLSTPEAETSLARMMQTIGRRGVRSINMVRGQSGSPWAGRFRSAVVETPGCYLDALRFVEWPRSWASLEAADAPVPLDRSSLRHRLGLERSPVVVEHPAFWQLGNTPFEREVAYRRSFEVEARMNEADWAARRALAGWVLGSKVFAAEIAERAGRRTERISPGRPRRRNLSPN